MKLEILNFYDNFDQYISLTKDIFSIMQYSHHFKGFFCPHCKNHNIIKNGKSGGRQRYLCKECNKTFNDLTKTPFAWMHNLEKVPKYINCMLEGKTLRDTARIVGISLPKSFFMRHKFAAVLGQIAPPKQALVRELKEEVTNFSAKGSRNKLKEETKRKVSILFNCDNNGKLLSDVHDVENRHNNILLRKLSQESYKNIELCHDDLRVINTLPKKIMICDTSKLRKMCEYYNCRRINSLVKKWNRWKHRFHGVASKYLANYLHWHDFLINTTNYNSLDIYLKLTTRALRNMTMAEIKKSKLDL
jgi:transposase-like protein